MTLLGPPVAWGGTSRKYREPSLLLYGTVDLSFHPRPPHHLSSISWEAGERGAFCLTSACTVTDWAFTPEWTFEEVEDYLRERSLPFVYRDAPGPDASHPWLLVSDVVTISFHDGPLYGLFASC